jgi:phytoene desaturase
MTRPSVLIIGAGIGGITAAIHLARAGSRVTVLEKNGEPGGRCGRFVREGHWFDTGPTLVVMRPLYEAEFGALGADVDDRLGLRPVDPTYRLVFDDGSDLHLTADMPSMHDQLEAIEPGSFDGFRRYVREGQGHYDLVLDRLVNKDFRRLVDVLDPTALTLLYRLKPFVNHYRNIGGYFKTPRLKSAFTFQDLYVGLIPFAAPATFSLLPYTEIAHGVWYPRRGMFTIVESLMDLAESAGVEFRFDAAVDRIGTVGDRATGATLSDGSTITADVVLANADLPYVYEHLLPDRPAAERMSRKDFSSSAISFFWGLDKTYGELGPHTLFLADDYRENFETITRDRGLPTNPSLYVHAPARLDATMAPPGGDTLTAIVPVGHLANDGRQDWDSARDQAREHILRRLATVGLTDVRSQIKFEVAYTPVTFAERHNLANGSTHGLSHKLTQMAFLRPSNRHRRYRNLYFVGASTHPGTGVPIAMVSGRLVAERIAAEQRLS